jgi:hypothetical protein
MTDAELHYCAICGVPTATFIVHAVERRDGSGEVHSDPAPGDRRYYCKKHLPHLHSERLEDRIE